MAEMGLKLLYCPNTEMFVSHLIRVTKLLGFWCFLCEAVPEGVWNMVLSKWELTTTSDWTAHISHPLSDLYIGEGECVCVHVTERGMLHLYNISC
jgi:hypothetical protein